MAVEIKYMFDNRIMKLFINSCKANAFSYLILVGWLWKDCCKMDICIYCASKTFKLYFVWQEKVQSKDKGKSWKFATMAHFFKTSNQNLVFGRVSSLLVPFFVSHKDLFNICLVQTYYLWIVMCSPLDIWKKMLKLEEDLIHCLSTKLVCLDKVVGLIVSCR